MLENDRRYLVVPYEAKDAAKMLGARFDVERKLWFIPAIRDTTPFKQWLGQPQPKPKQYDDKPLPERSAPDSPAYLAFQAWWRNFKKNPPPTPHKDVIGSFVRVGAIIAERTKEDREADRELEQERAAVQAEGKPIHPAMELYR